MTTKPQTIALAVFQDVSKAQDAILALKEAGFRDDQIGVVSPHPDGKAVHVAEGAVAGAATGASMGTLWALGIAAGILPGIGPAVAGGLLASVLASAASGAAVAGLVGALVGLGIPEEEARHYENDFIAGRTIVTVQAEGRTPEAWAILQRFAGTTRRPVPEGAGV